jgi:hypothetical protein
MALRTGFGAIGGAPVNVFAWLLRTRWSLPVTTVVPVKVTSRSCAGLRSGALLRVAINRLLVDDSVGLQELD